MQTPLTSARPDFGGIPERLMQLTDRERLVLRLRFALDGSYYHSLNDIAQGLKVSTDDVREIETQALRKIQGGTPTV